MKLSLNPDNLIEYLAKQLNFFFPDQVDVLEAIRQVMPSVLERMDHCFCSIHKKYYKEDNQSVFNHLNSDHYAMFLYWISNQAYRNERINLAEKAFLLNKALHGIDAFYSISLPDIFLFVHPIGTILGNAQYQDYFVVYQNVTIGTDVGGVYPTFGKANVLYSKSSVIGTCQIGNNVSFAAHSSIRNTDIPADSIVVGMYPNGDVKKNTKNNKSDFFG